MITSKLSICLNMTCKTTHAFMFSNREWLYSLTELKRQIKADIKTQLWKKYNYVQEGITVFFYGSWKLQKCTKHFWIRSSLKTVCYSGTTLWTHWENEHTNKLTNQGSYPKWNTSMKLARVVLATVWMEVQHRHTQPRPRTSSVPAHPAHLLKAGDEGWPRAVP